MEVPGAGEFGLNYRIPVGECGVFEKDVLYGDALTLDSSFRSTFERRVQTDLVHVCAVNDTSDWWHILLAVTD